MFLYNPVIFNGTCYTVLTIMLALNSDLPLNFITMDLDSSSLVTDLCQFNVTNVNTTMSSYVLGKYQSAIIPSSDNYTYDVNFTCDSDAFPNFNIVFFIVASVVLIIYISIFVCICIWSLKLDPELDKSTSMITGPTFDSDISLDESHESL